MERESRFVEEGVVDDTPAAILGRLRGSKLGESLMLPRD